jgi:hypothetical protein
METSFDCLYFSGSMHAMFHCNAKYRCASKHRAKMVVRSEVRPCRGFFMLKLLIVALLAAVCAVCAGCAGTSGGSSSAGGGDGSSGITMYGVIDEGISVRK